MKVTGGRLRGRTLPHAVPEGVRPTSARVREALFNILGQDLTGSSVLDAFGGSGMLALEAWSRGAEPVVVVELDGRAAQAIRTAAAKLGASLEVRQGKCPASAPRGPFDLVLVDPPYAQDLAPILQGLAPRVAGCLVAEHRSRVTPPQVEGLELLRTRRYGDTSLSFYRPSEGAGR